ncbi:rRNA biogenesis protein RRP36 [Fomitiporia mediterranea MF3/22]|uniref:rRNA biogenesis protein RRP36 n=1 Tax=Fomitiporia mediterranea (strain MF3/22) TaxID=694068 RepID=UPI0004409320|nr:rRNA biogenesis protein RRP36 [Fomitiporia mediterranea MF3/22]EJD04095.1 rRNA biogenesis protein RRP36 [Fomitiporia mediterranea MF3/22]
MNEYGSEEGSGPSEEESGTDIDIDGPRVAQWGGDEDDGNVSNLELEYDKGEGPSKPTQVPDNDISSLPYGSLLKARRVLDQARVESDLDNSDGAESDDDSYVSEGNIKEEQSRTVLKQKPAKPEKRAHKHAPVEMTSKRAVTRRRQVVEVKKVNYRDPRFSSVTNDDVQESFRKNYSFLEDIHKNEYDALKENVKRARKLLRSSPRDQREAREEELDRLERAFKRAESAINRDRREAVERQALEKAHKEEKERRKSGKGEWHMKKSAKKELLLKARHDALAESGGRLAVRKAIEKRQKKISQKEKRQRPSFAGRPPQRGNAENQRSSKRRKVSVS